MMNHLKGFTEYENYSINQKPRNMKKLVQYRFTLLIKSPFYQRLSPSRKILSKIEFLNCPDNDILYIKFYTIF